MTQFVAAVRRGAREAYMDSRLPAATCRRIYAIGMAVVERAADLVGLPAMLSCFLQFVNRIF